MILFPDPTLMQPSPYDELLRPQFHFTARSGWLNDPNGLGYENGEYHLFFQHNPQGVEWGNMTWGHAVSRDLVRWTQIQNAIEPDARGTIFSGSAVTDPLNTSGLAADLIAIYTSAGGTSEASKGQPFTQSLAYSKDHGRTWTKLPKPILSHIVDQNRDPKVTWHAGSKSWVMALYLTGDNFALFRSSDMRDWKEIQRFTMPGSSECPDFFEMPVEGTKERRWVFTGANGRYLVGEFDGVAFTPLQEPAACEFGANNYAVQTFFGLPKERRVQIGWMRDGKYPFMPFNQQMTIPCELKLRQEGSRTVLYRYPVKEVESLWTRSEQASDLLDIDCSFESGNEPVKLRFHGVEVTYDPKSRNVSLLGKSAYLVPEQGRISLRILVDRTSVELFGNQGRVCISMCKLPEAPTAVKLEGAVNGKLRVTPLESAWAQVGG